MIAAIDSGFTHSWHGDVLSQLCRNTRKKVSDAKGQRFDVQLPEPSVPNRWVAFDLFVQSVWLFSLGTSRQLGVFHHVFGVEKSSNGMACGVVVVVQYSLYVNMISRVRMIVDYIVD